MRRIKVIICTILLFPIKLFSKVSPLTLIRSSTVGKKSAILSGTRFYNSSIDDYSYIGRNCYVDRTIIGRFCSIADNCCIGLASHPTSWASTSPVFHSGRNVLGISLADRKFDSIKTTVVGNDVWIGMNVCIISGVHIGTGAVIGAGAIVTKDVEPYAIVGGSPAKLIRFRFDESERELLLKSEWWKENEDRLKKASEDIDDIGRFISYFN